MRFKPLIGAMLLALLATTSMAAASEVQVQWGAKIPLRHGIELNASVYRPADQAEPLPVIFTMTPYIADSYHDRAHYFAGNGYVFALVDVRGRGNSAGQFKPFAHDADDGHDVVAFLAQQPWSDGQVTMWGGSYAGWNQWAVASRSPEHLATIVPAASPWLGIDFPMSGNIFYSYDIRWLTLTSGLTPNSRLFGESDLWNQIYLQRYREHQPFAQLDEIAGNTSTVFDEWLAHPWIDDYWRSYNPSDAQYAQIDLPILTITGHYDGDQAGAMTHYLRHMAHASQQARQRHYLIIGPWDHADTRSPDGKVGGLEFPDNSQLDLNALHKAWYDWTLKDGDRPEFLDNRVAVYVMGRNEWRYAESLRGLTSDTLTLHLDSDGEAGDALHSGGLSSTASTQARADEYVYDPLDTRFGELEADDHPRPMLDQTWAISNFGNGVVYHSAPFEEPVEITGYPQLTVWLSIDQPDTDFSANLYEITRDGTSIFLTSQILRARYRDSLFAEGKPVPAGEPVEYVFDGFTFFSREIAAGSRLRLLINSPNTIHLEKNYNTGGVVATESGKDARTVRVRIHHGPDHPSRLMLPTHGS